MGQVIFSARHESLNSIQTYALDTATIYEIQKKEWFNNENTVSPFRSVRININIHGTRATPSTIFQKDLPDLVD